MAIPVHDRSIPKEILSTITELEKEAYVNLRVGRYKKAEELFGNQLDLIVKWQVKRDKPIHKGTPMHMVGICLLYQGEIPSALWFFLLAYIEDTLNVGLELESEADLYPASLMLRNAFRIDVGFLKAIKEYVSDLKRKKQWVQARDPAKILSAISGTVKPSDLLALCKSIPEAPKSSQWIPCLGFGKKEFSSEVIMTISPF